MYPEWYRVVRAASYYGVKPWELAEQPSVWTEWAVTAADAEMQAETERMVKMFAKIFGGKKT